MYVVSTVVPFASFACTLTGTTSPEYDLSVGVNVTTPVALSTVYLPTTFPSGDLASTDSAGLPFSSNKVIVSLLIGATGLPSVNVTVPVCTIPCGATDSAGVAVGVTGVTVGVYLAVTSVPFLSTRLTVTPVPSPVNDFSGTNVTVPSGATVYVPSPGTVLVVDPSSNVAGVSSSISTVFSTPSTVALPPSNVGLPVCVLP